MYEALPLVSVKPAIYIILSLYFLDKILPIINKASKKELVEMLSEKLGESWEKVGRKLGENQIKIILLLFQDSNITIDKLSKIIGISDTAIENNLAKLKKFGLIKRRGADRSGYWEVIEDGLKKE